MINFSLLRLNAKKLPWKTMILLKSKLLLPLLLVKLEPDQLQSSLHLPNKPPKKLHPVSNLKKLFTVGQHARLLEVNHHRPRNLQRQHRQRHYKTIVRLKRYRILIGRKVKLGLRNLMTRFRFRLLLLLGKTAKGRLHQMTTTISKLWSNPSDRKRKREELEVR
jgi:hypothetical protein